MRMRAGSLKLEKTIKGQRELDESPIRYAELESRWNLLSKKTKTRIYIAAILDANRRYIYMLSLPVFWVVTMPQIDGHSHLILFIVSLLAWFYAGLYGYYTKRL